MQLFKQRYLAAPLLILGVAFLFDKIFALPSVQRYTVIWKKVEPPFYKSRYDLFRQLQERYPDYRSQRKRLGLILGTSRSAEFSPGTIARALPDSVTYNFSAPFACPSFHYYWLKRILDAGLELSFVMVEADPVVFSPRSINYSLAYSYDTSFVLSHTDLGRTMPRQAWEAEGRGFSFDEAETYLLKNLFALYRYPLNFSTISENRKEITLPDPDKGFVTFRGMDFREKMLETVRQANRENLGGIPNPLHFTVPEERMEQDARESFQHLQFDEFEPEVTQIIFFKKLVRELARRNIPLVLYWPVSTPPFYRILEEHDVNSTIRGPMTEFLEKTRSKYPGARISLMRLQNDPRLTCRAFIDSYHLSGSCYDQLTRLLFSGFRSLSTESSPE